MAWEPPEVTASNSNWEPPEISASNQTPMPQGPDMSPFQLQGSNPATMALSAAGQTFGMQPTSASTAPGAALQTVQNQVMAPARLSNTVGEGGQVAGQAAQNLMQKAGANPLMQGASNLIASAAVDPRSYAMPGEDVSITPDNLPGAKIGEMISGTPASNLNRAYKGGFYDTYIAPQSMAKSGQQFGDAYKNAVTKFMSPEEQASTLINPKGEANQKIADVYTQWINNQPISTKDAVSAKVAIGTVFPTNTAKNASKIARLSQFENDLDGVIAQDQSPEAQAFSKANANYAASALRSNLSKPMPVNKSNPEEYSKLARYLPEALGVGGGMAGHGLAGAIGGAGTLLATSPLAMGVAASGAGSLASLADRAASNPAIQAIFARYLENQTKRQGTSQ